MLTPYYDQDGQTIYHGDCREILPELDPVDLVLTDPPYGISADAGQAERANTQRGQALAISRDYGGIRFDSASPCMSLLSDVIGAGRNAVIFGANHFGLPASSCWLVWDKDNGANRYADCELAWTNFLGAVRRKRYRWQGMLQEYAGRYKETRFHPTQKPVPIMRWCISLAGENVVTILDPFMGSGTTLRAAKDLGRKCIGIEIEERYCEIAANRLAQGVLDFEGAATGA